MPANRLELVPRRALDVAVEFLPAFRVTVLHGARQVGKTTMAKQLAGRLGAAYVSLDEVQSLAAATSDPRTFLETYGTPLVIDEIQRVGQPLVLSIKIVVDNDNAPGQFVLTGSTNFLTVPTISESLAGRVNIVPLWPLSQGELRGGSDGFVDRAFGGSRPLVLFKGPVLERDDYLKALCVGGYPAVQAMGDRARRVWIERYVDTVLDREVAVADDIRRLDAMKRMVRLFAAASGQELVISALAARLGIDRATTAQYEPWLETVFLVHRLPAWSRNLTAKVVRRPKMFMTDTAVAAGLVGKDAAALRRPTDPAAGPLFENFVVNELAKQLTWCETSARMYHFRDRDGADVDIVLEAADGRVVAVETKASSTPRPEDFRWLAFLRDRIDRSDGEFVAGVVLHTGERRLPFGDRLVALPAADVWT
ncbi:MAG: ATP-binding protein [Pseudonocardia sp.]